MIFIGKFICLHDSQQNFPIIMDIHLIRQSYEINETETTILRTGLIFNLNYPLNEERYHKSYGKAVQKSHMPDFSEDIKTMNK